jgi:hypothetical protein
MAVLAVVTLAGLAGAGRAHAATPPAPPGFGEPTISGIQGYGYEQGLAIDPQNGNMYTSAPNSAASGTSFIWHSTDGGQTFKWIPEVTPLNGKPITCAGGGDSEVAVDSNHHLYFNDLTLANFSVARSDDGGTSFAPTPSCTGVPEAGVDRQWYATQGDPVNSGALFLAYDRVAQTLPAGVCPVGTAPGNNVLVIARSPAFGLPGSTAGIQFSPSQVISCNEGIMGNDVFFNYPCTQGPNCHGGNSPEVFVVHDDTAFGKISVGRCDVVPESATNLPGLQNCVDTVVSDFTGVGVTGGNFPTISVDSSGGLFAVWERAPGTLTIGANANTANITGNTQLYYSFGSNMGTTWSTPAQLPSTGSNQALFAWPASGDPGRVDVGYYGAPEPWATGDTTGPDSIVGHYGLYVVQTLDGGATWSPPVLASSHFIHYGTMYTVIGGQVGNRTLGDFLKLRAGPQGQAVLSYGDSNNDTSTLTPEAMVVQQISGPSLYASGAGTVNGIAPSATGCVTDPPGDATFDAAGTVSANQLNLELQQVCMTQPDASHYQITMTVSSLISLSAAVTGEGTTLIWQTQWIAPSATDHTNGGAMFMAYMESVNGAAPTCWVGQNAATLNGGGALITYPGTTQLTAAQCTYTATAPGTITMTIPLTAVTEAGAGTTLYSVTGSTQTLAGQAEDPALLGGIGGHPFNLIDVAPAFEFPPPAAVNTPEAPWVPLVVVVGAVATGVGLRRARRRGAAEVA